MAENHLNCAICGEEDVLYVGIRPCGHNDMCYRCTLHMWVLNGNSKCPVCQSESAWIVIASNSNRNDASITPRSPKVSSLPHTMSCIVSKKDEPSRNVKAYLHSSVPQSALAPLVEYQCSQCPGRQVFPTVNALQQHIKKQAHSKNVCLVCAQSRTEFACDLKLYSALELARHNAGELADEAPFRGHPTCSFCKRAFFSVDDLYTHLCQSHKLCSLCSVAGKRYSFLRNEQDFFAHLRSKHYVCNHPDCVAKGAVNPAINAFRNDIEFSSHLLSEHAASIPPQIREGLSRISLALIQRSQLPMLADPPRASPRVLSFEWEEEVNAPVAPETRQALLAMMRGPTITRTRPTPVAWTNRDFSSVVSRAKPKEKFPALKQVTPVEPPEPRRRQKNASRSASRVASTEPSRAASPEAPLNLDRNVTVRKSMNDIIMETLATAGIEPDMPVAGNIKGLIMSVVDHDITPVVFQTSLDKTCARGGIDLATLVNAMESTESLSPLIDLKALKQGLGISLLGKGRGKKKGRR
ncbi:Zinc finger, C3HC4 type (RING finger) [Carpediemonas membranifera]|uniref:Zinc finger, C3HC4 type (RING finger) n=1 Tax=Carpediemonas membranifera TaxID=201153 RepID=A0A8J6EBD3_9EUKA|nr:Zinc finger, C3HC4 type (RING finger) [Carpediemonas membranifera]|eukprot:KAG9396895.1 Zinc finger, C3HC4 type (RING finger) [Carpediemonas membranifera]